jgi:hypothetical protein
MIPIFGIVMIIAVVLGPIWIVFYFRSRERAQLHETLRVAYEKGLPPPPELVEKLASTASASVRDNSPNADLRRAVVLIAVGVGLVGLGLGLGFGIPGGGGDVTMGSVAGAGAIPGMIGVAYLFLWFMRRNEPKA